MGLVQERVKAIYDHIKAHSDDLPDVLLFRNATEPHLDLSFFYVTGVPGGLFEGSTTLAFPDGKVVLFTSPLEEESARHGKGYDVKVYGGQVRQDDLVLETIQETLGDYPNRIGLNAREITWTNQRNISKLFPDAKLMDVSPAVKAARMVKDAAEVKALRKAADAVSKVGAMVPDLLETGITEAELAARMDYEVMRAGGDGRSFTTIVAFGPRSSEPHYHPKDVPLEKEQYVLCDFGAFADRYASDMTRTWYFGKKPSAKHEKVYRTVLDAQLIGIDLLRAGGSGGDVHKKVAAHIDATEFKGRFIHSTGHTIGLSVHDGGTLHPAVDTVLAPGQVWTCEPGIYLPGFGGVRIEDDILITDDGPDVITTAPKEWTVVEP
ncbi:MAG: Xaa-Pro peptidase family protein [Euryarchaeota archaeon]|nr:Xaa-Pro peptidase family protein [Euryarchaeota archaeon]